MSEEQVHHPHVSPRPAVVWTAFCPHCFRAIASATTDAWPPTPSRCPHCRQTIAVGEAARSAMPEAVAGPSGAEPGGGRAA